MNYDALREMLEQFERNASDCWYTHQDRDKDIDEIIAFIRQSIGDETLNNSEQPQ